MCGVDLVLKLCNLVVEVGCGKCLVEGCLPGCLEARVGMKLAGRASEYMLTISCGCWCMLRR